VSGIPVFPAENAMASRYQSVVFPLVILFVVVGVVVTRFLSSLVFSPGAAEAKLKEELESKGRLFELQQIARRMVEKQTTVPEPSERLKLADWGITSITPFHASGRLAGVGFLLGSADQHVGVIIFPGDEDHPVLDQHVKRWSKGVWYYSEVPWPKRD
jgi:hypothetical protein